MDQDGVSDANNRYTTEIGQYDVLVSNHCPCHDDD